MHWPGACRCFSGCRDRDRLEAQANATIALATEQGFPNYRIDAEILRAWALSDRGEPGATTRLIQDALRGTRRVNYVAQPLLSVVGWQARRPRRAPWTTRAATIDAGDGRGRATGGDLWLGPTWCAGG